MPDTHVTLNNGTVMPRVGLGTSRTDDDTVADLVTRAIGDGYRLIDTATRYGNETGVGRGIRRAGIAREEMFVTTKVWNDSHGRDATLAAFDASLDRLGMDYVDLYLVHWPVPARGLTADTWRALEELAADGRARAIGVSNFRIEDLDLLAAETGTVPAVNQIELHPHMQQHDLREYHAAHGIITQAWSPMAKGRGGILSDPAVRAIADAHGRSPAQVVLRWHLQHGTTVIPKTATPQRLAGNIDLFGFALTDGEMAAVDAMNTDTRYGPDPAVND